MKKNVSKILLVMLVLGVVPMAVQATIIAEYAFTEGSAVSIDADTGTAAGDYGFTGPTVYPEDGISSVTESKYTRAKNTAASLADAITAGKYDYFTITYVSGGTVEFDTFTYDYTVSSIYQTFTSYVLVDADNDGFDSGDSVGSCSLTGVQDSTVSQSVSIDISSLANLTSGSIAFRIYYTDNSTSNTRYHRVDNVTVNATVPEPATLALLGLGSLLFFRRVK